ncbi:MAG: OstA-like protein [Flavipsychrobacter sp.]|jgi:lipopolysaccharide export system protein LptA|nr:OstA-like protein [Flavipsychrobacter sp.]
MRFVFSLLLLFPVLCIAQKKDESPFDKKGDGKIKLAHADKTVSRPAVKKEGEKKKLKDDEVYYGNVKFTVGDNAIACDSAIHYRNDDKIVAYQVTVSSPMSFTVKSNELAFNTNIAKASLSGNVSVTAQTGRLVGTSENLELDFSYQIYRMGQGVLKIPEKKDEKQ